MRFPGEMGPRRARAPPAWSAVEERPQAFRIGLRWLAPTVVRRYPREVPVPALGPVGSSELRATTCLRMRPVLPGEALRRVREDRAHVHAEVESLPSEGDPRRGVLEQEMQSVDQLEEALVARRTRLWDLVLGVVGEGGSADRARSVADQLEGELAPLGFRFHASHWRAPELLGVVEGRGEPGPALVHPLPEEGVAALLPLWEDRLDEPGGVLVGVHARLGTPLLLDRFGHPSHSSAIFGQTGSGKSYASALGWMRLRWVRSDLSVFVLDPLGGLANVVRELGGKVLTVGAAGGLAINPLDPGTTGGDARAKAARVGGMLRALFPSLRDEESAVLDATLCSLYGGPGGTVPLLSDLYRALAARRPPPTRLLDLLQAAVGGSLRGLDRPTSLDLDAPLIGFDLSGVTPEELPFFLMLLLDLVYGEVRRREGPKLIVLDEAHYLARAGATAAFLDHMVRHVRHFRAGLELLSQNPQDFLADERGRSILLNLDSVLLLRLRDGGEGIAPLLGLRPEEVEAVRNADLPGTTGWSSGLLRTGGLHLPIAVLAAPEEDRLLRRAFAAEGARGGTGSTSERGSELPSGEGAEGRSPATTPFLPGAA